MSALIRLLFALGCMSPTKIPVGGHRPPSKPSDRRSSPRHPASSNKTYIGWWTGEKFHSVAGQIRNISSGGAVPHHEGRAAHQAYLDRSGQADRNTLESSKSRPRQGDFGWLGRGRIGF